MSRFLLFAVPRERWIDAPRKTPPDSDELLREQLCEARSLRERITSGVNLERERERFSSAMSRIEAELLRRLASAPDDTLRAEWDVASLRGVLDAGNLPVLELDEGYLHLQVAAELARAEKRTLGISERADPLALGSSVFEAAQLADHLAACDADVAALGDAVPKVGLEAAERRAGFLRAARELGSVGIVEVQIPLNNHGAIRPAIERPPRAAAAVHSPPVEPFEGYDPSERRSRRDQMVQRLDRDVAAAVEQFRRDGRGGKVNASNQPHEVTTDVLGAWVRAGGGAARVRIVYSDGSEAAPFPVCCLGGRGKPEKEPKVFKAALMSMRHLDIDRIVDFAWYRNREVSQTRSLAESDEFCFHESLAQLRRLYALAARIEQPIRLEIYHTGFEPASMGFYRAVTAVLTAADDFQAGWASDLPAHLIVAPFYYRGGTTYEASRDQDGNVLEWF